MQVIVFPPCIRPTVPNLPILSEATLAVNTSPNLWFSTPSGSRLQTKPDDRKGVEFVFCSRKVKNSSHFSSLFGTEVPSSRAPFLLWRGNASCFVRIFTKITLHTGRRGGELPMDPDFVLRKSRSGRRIRTRHPLNSTDAPVNEY